MDNFINKTLRDLSLDPSGYREAQAKTVGSDLKNINPFIPAGCSTR